MSNSLAPPLNDLSATTIREALAARVARASEVSIAKHVPPETVQFVSEAQVYRSPQSQAGEVIDVYGIRIALIELLYSVRSWAEHEVDFCRLLQRAVADDPTGHALRHARPSMPRDDLIGLLRSSLD